ncbi:MAG TPA: proline dehydrogenase family protein [Ignavibacteriales bacterium]|nr:proline dehydrogenase family protein [Ignavibacteriales bacterium]HOL82289.1 proline dehydrogenase family protein [Ignavibacteriales bacterium]HOM66250.1 proline dehydrogenase family protein [Ignavibacteriales bacterium]HPD68397.1 proline dehydrogenase family protein [Ignavibacteriales bacterium]HPP34369.1 proline dehydrogenase family protein [Ignavibacteriales bacterium]
MSILNSLLLSTIKIMPKSVIRYFASNYIAGESLTDAINVIKKLKSEGFDTTIDLLGEFVDSHFLAIKSKEDIIDDIRTIGQYKLPTYHSLKLTQLGLGVNVELCEDNLTQILTAAKENNVFVRIDMENTPYTSLTLEIYKRMRKNFDNIGIVLQAYLYRTEKDIEQLKEYQPNVRLVKGIYIEEPKDTIKDKQKIRDNYLKLLDKMLEYKFHVAIATHDDYLTDNAKELIKKYSLSKQDYEFEMLLGVRNKLRNQLRDEGHRVVIYVPYGIDWYGYSIRRFNENPSVAMHVFKSIFHIN